MRQCHGIDHRPQSRDQVPEEQHDPAHQVEQQDFRDSTADRPT